ncbi:hypothetical protein [Aquimarina rubra]|uniref:Tetratricopeptide repeat protein n=1 Tax=Aquimarina rubra TaxID=1920033 RepID=A0ABW5LDU5_9FLAO
MNFGIYYFDIVKYHKALENFNLAFELDKDTYLLTEHVEKTNTESKHLSKSRRYNHPLKDPFPLLLDKLGMIAQEINRFK